jgi:hypothetical protein
MKYKLRNKNQNFRKKIVRKAKHKMVDGWMVDELSEALCNRNESRIRMVIIINHVVHPMNTLERI